MLDIVIVSYRCRDHLRACLASVERHAPAGTNVWVVDNDSRDGTVEFDRFGQRALGIIFLRRFPHQSSVDYQ